MLKDRKKAVADILIALAPKRPMEPEGENESEEEESEDMDMGIEAAAEDVLAAIKRQDAKALAVAMKSLVEMC
jgi:hypothetical protein